MRLEEMVVGAQFITVEAKMISEAYAARGSALVIKVNWNTIFRLGGPQELVEQDIVRPQRMPFCN